MSKPALIEIGLGAAAAAAAVADFFTAGATSPLVAYLTSMSISMTVAGAAAGISSLLAPNMNGMSQGFSTPIGPWCYVYGTLKVGGTEIFRQSNNSGGVSNDKSLHRVYVLACHPCVAQAGAFQLRIDGKQVLVAPIGYESWHSYSPTQLWSAIASISRDVNGLVTFHLNTGIDGLDGTTNQIKDIADNTFNGNWILSQPNPADNTTFTFICGGSVTTSTGGSLTTCYADYKDKIYLEFLDGNHISSFPTLLGAGTDWSASDLCLGRTLAYVRMGYDETVFPSSIPNVAWVIQGKNNILDPRTGTRGFTNNAALCIADFLSLPVAHGGFGLTIGTDIPTAQLIAAANICDEAIPLAGGGTIPRYTCDASFSLSENRGSILQKMLSSCAGRISYQGGQYFIVPGVWTSPTLTLTDADIVGTFKFRPRFSIRDTCNAVKGVYVSPENNYQPGDFPPYMQDVEHGYTSDLYLAEDQGERIFRDISLPCTANSATAQRLAKIELMRTRFQLRGTIRCTMKAYQAVALDVISLTHPRYTWLNKYFEVLSSRFVMDQSGGGAPTLAVELDLAETDSSVYSWTIAEQLTAQGYAQPDNVGNSVCSPPDSVTVYSGYGETINGIVYPSTITKGADGSLRNSIYVSWREPNDANVMHGGHIEVQWQIAGASVWTALGKFDPSVACCFIPSVSEGVAYNVQVRAVKSAGVPSVWVIVGPEIVSDTYSTISYSGIPVAPPGTLSAQGLSDGTAQIQVSDFTPGIGGVLAAACTPSPSTLTGLNQSQVYWVYYVDPTFSGGTITPIATSQISDFLNKVGYLLIGSITTPSYVRRYKPSAFIEIGDDATTTPAAAYDQDINTAAILRGDWSSVFYDPGPPPLYNPDGEWVDSSSSGQCEWNSFPSSITSASATLTIVYAASLPGSNPSEVVCDLKVNIGGSLVSTLTISAAISKTTWTVTIPSGTDLSTIAVIGGVQVAAIGQGSIGSCQISVYDIFIQ